LLLLFIITVKLHSSSKLKRKLFFGILSIIEEISLLSFDCKLNGTKLS